MVHFFQALFFEALFPQKITLKTLFKKICGSQEGRWRSRMGKREEKGETNTAGVVVEKSGKRRERKDGKGEEK